MRKPMIISIIFAALVLLPGFAVQAQILELTGSADCEGWSTVSTLTFPDGVYYSELDYSVVLTDQGGAEVVRFDWAGMIYRYENPVMVVMNGDPWGLALDSSYGAQLVFHFLGEESVLDFDLVCGEGGNDPEPEVEPCRQSPGFWKNHSELWPADLLSLGGIEMDQSQLIEIMRMSVRGNGSLLLARELIAAKLNVANGCDDSINATIEEADLFLIENPLADSFWGHRVPSSRDLRIALSVYNKAGCPESEAGDEGMMVELEGKASAIDQTSLGALKAIYR
jgi:hypothetical protein